MGTRTLVKIPVIESERGWGPKVDDHMVCLTVEDALEFKVEFNSKNDKDVTPDWYMYCDDQPIPFTVSEKHYNTVLEQVDKRLWLSSLNKIYEF